MISEESGAIQISPETAIAIEASPADLEGQVIRNRDGWDDRDGHKWTILSLEPIVCRGRFVLSTFRFCDDVLFSADFAVSDDRFGGSSWSDYSKDKELERKAAHDQLLNEVLGSKRDFPWGTVWSVFDERSGGSSFGVNYTNNREQGGGGQAATRSELT